MTPRRLLLLLFTAQIFLVPTLCTEDKDDEESLKRSLPVYTIISNADQLNSTRCRKELEELKDAIDGRRLWGLKVLDSNGMPSAGFLYGNNYWMGNRLECEDLVHRTPFALSLKELKNASRYRKPEEEFPPFDFQFFVAYFRHNTTLQYHVMMPLEDVITFGICLPASCTKYELAAIIENAYENRTLIVSDMYLADLELLEVKDLKDDHQWLVSGIFIVYASIFLVTLLLMAAGTYYDVFIFQENEEKSEKLHNCENNNTSIQLSTKQPDDDTEGQQKKSISSSTFGQAIRAFSIYTNTKILCNMNVQADSIPAIHGIRFLGMVWIVIVHTLFYSSDFVDNSSLMWKKGDGLIEQVVSNSTLAVDTFFFLSGFLMTYLFLIGSKKEGNRPRHFRIQIQKFLTTFIKRYMRLTPAYIATMGIFYLNTKWYSKTSLFNISERGDKICSKYWWRNILYIQNFFSRETMCMSWSWYLANDMQFFMLGTILLMLTQRYFKAVAFMVVFFMVGSMVITGYTAYTIEFIPTMDQQFHFLHVLYDPPWTRIGPYLVGMITSYIYIKLDRKLELKRHTIVLLWILGISCNCLTLFGLAERQISLTASVFYTSFSRTVWGVGIAWVVIACSTDHAGIVNKILSFRGWFMFSRLTYSVYLLNPILISSINLFSESSMHIDILPMAATVLGNAMICYVCAYFLALMFEVPYTALTKQLLDYLNRKK